MSTYFRTTILALSTLTALATTSVHAESGESDNPGQNRLVAGIAHLNPMGMNDRDRREAVRLEYRMGAVPVWKLHPWLGVEYGQRGGLWAGAGLETDINLTTHLILTLQTGVGYQEDGRDLRNDNTYPPTGIMFRSQIELGYELPGMQGTRVGVGITHASHAEIQGDENPGLEGVGLNLHIPTDIFKD